MIGVFHLSKLDSMTLAGKLRFLFVAIFIFSICSCSNGNNERINESNFFQITGKAQGTSFKIIYNDSLSRDFSIVIDSILNRVDQQLSTYDTSSFISLINTSKDTCFQLGDNDLFKFCFALSKEMHVKTIYSFNPAIYPLVDYWGFFSNDDLSIDTLYVQDSLLPITYFNDVFNFHFLNGKEYLCKKSTKAKLDFNAIAQGYSVDLIANYFNLKLVSDYMVEIGGEIKTKGVNSRGKLWNIGIERPVDSSYTGQYGFQKIIPLDNQSLATSGSYRKFKMINGKRYSHTIDPKTGFPSKNRLLSTTIICKDAAVADALATACMVLGKEKAMRLVTTYEHEKIKGYFIYDSAGVYKEWANF